MFTRRFGRPKMVSAGLGWFPRLSRWTSRASRKTKHVQLSRCGCRRIFGATVEAHRRSTARGTCHTGLPINSHVQCKCGVATVLSHRTNPTHTPNTQSWKGRWLVLDCVLWRLPWGSAVWQLLLWLCNVVPPRGFYNAAAAPSFGQ